MDEVAHAIRLGKKKSDREMLALVTVVSTFVGHLRDWETWKDVDALYKVLEMEIQQARKERRRERREKRDMEKRRGSVRKLSTWHHEMGERRESAASTGSGSQGQY